MRTVLAEFFYSAILWGSLITWVLWWLRKHSTSGIARKLLWLPLAWFGLHTALAWYGFVLPPSGRLVDADSGQPIKQTRVIATWIGVLPPSLWTTVCSGRQAHLTDADGDFAFRYAPLPTLFSGMVARGLNPEAPGYIDNRRAAFILVPLRGDLPLQHYVPARKLTGGPNTGCKLAISTQYETGSIRGEQNRFKIAYREACIEHQPWTLTDAYLFYTLIGGTDFELERLLQKLPSDSPLRGPWPVALQEEIHGLAPNGCRPAGGLCVAAIETKARDQLCSFLEPLNNLEQEDDQP